MSANYPGIDASFRIANPDDVTATMTITMKIKQWREIADALSADKYEQWPLRAAIMDLVRTAGTKFTADPA